MNFDLLPDNRYLIIDVSAAIECGLLTKKNSDREEEIEVITPPPKSGWYMGRAI